MQSKVERIKALAAGIVVSGLMTLTRGSSAQAAVVYSLDMSISGTAFNGLITIDNSSANDEPAALPINLMFLDSLFLGEAFYFRTWALLFKLWI